MRISKLMELLGTDILFEIEEQWELCRKSINNSVLRLLLPVDEGI
jgi:hypothetical protein